MNDSIDKQMTCYQAQRLVDLYIASDPSLSADKRNAFKTHLRNCQECEKKYRKAKWIVGLVKESWPYDEENQAFLKRLSHPEQREQVIDECWEDLKRRIPELGRSGKTSEKQRVYLPLVRRVSAAAACLAIGVFAWMVFSSYSKPKIVPEPVTKQIAPAPKPSVRIELISKNGIVPILANQQIASNNELKTLIINGKHRLMMNTDTILTVKPLVKNSNLGCLVKLASGQVYTHVKHDGNPFVVDTAYGEAVITGTTFDIKATEDSTALVVSEGTVQFKSGNGVVNVAAAQKSEIVGQLAPTKPISCNVAELTAWATGYKPEPALVQAGSNTDISEVLTPWPNDKKPADLDEVDYNNWVKQKRDWFRLQFPQIFQLQHALNEEGIEVEYSELLIAGGDIWQFAYIKGRPDRFSALSFDSLLKTASNYGFDKQWLLKNATAAKYALEKPVFLKNSLTVLNAFGQWNSSFVNDGAKVSHLAGG